MNHSVDELRELIATSCRILAMTALTREITGHVSARLPGVDEMLVRCRPESDPGVAETTPDDVKRVTFDGESTELVDGYRLPGEFAIHSEIYRRRPDVGAVVHAHPRASLLCGIMGLELRPIIGAYDPPAMVLGLEGVPTYPRSVLISTIELGVELAEMIGSKDVCLLRGHGTVAVGSTVEDATVRAIKLETLAEITLQVAEAGGHAPDLPQEDIDALLAFQNAVLPTLPASHWTWSLYLKALEDSGHLSPSEHVSHGGRIG